MRICADSEERRQSSDRSPDLEQMVLFLAEPNQKKAAEQGPGHIEARTHGSV